MTTTTETPPETAAPPEADENAPETDEHWISQRCAEAEAEKLAQAEKLARAKVRNAVLFPDTVPTVTGKFQVMLPPTLDEYKALAVSIDKDGIWASNLVLVDENGDVIDGHYRKYIADKLGKECPTEVVTGLTEAEKIARAYTANVARRHLTTAQRKGLAAQSIKRQPELSDREHAHRCNLSDKTVTNVRKDLEARSEIPHVETRVDTKGRKAPANKGTRTNGNINASPKPEIQQSDSEEDARKGMTRGEKTRDTKRANAVNAFGVSMFHLLDAVAEIGKYQDILTSDNGSTIHMHVNNLENVIEVLKPFVAQAYAREV